MSEYSGPLSMKVVFPGEKMNSELLAEHVAASQTLLTGFNLLAMVDGQDYAEHSPVEIGLLSRDLLRNTSYEAAMAPVWRVGYNSPLEIVVGITISTTLLAATANRVIETFQRLLHLRRDHADTSLHVLRVQILREQLGALRAASDPLPTPEMDQLVVAVSRALDTVTEVEIIDDSVK